MEISRCKVIFEGKEIAKDVFVAKSFVSRLIGLMFKSDIKNGDGLLITRCRSIHTCWMNFSIDVLFLSKNLEVISVIENMKPWRLTWIYPRATQVLELRAGSLKGIVKKGDKVELICTN